MQVTQLPQKPKSILLPSAGMRAVNLRGQGVQLVMQGIDSHERGRHASCGKSLRIEPRAQAAWIGIQRRRRRPRALQVRHKMPVPGAVFNHGEQHRSITRVHYWHLDPLRIGTPCGRPGFEFPGRHGLGDSVSLCEIASQLQQHQAVVHRLHSLRNHLAAECLSQSQNALQDGQVLRLIEHIPHKTLVDLQHIGGQALQID